MPKFTSKEWLLVLQSIQIAGEVLKNHVAIARPVLASREIDRHVDAIVDELIALHQTVATEMGAAVEREKASRNGEIKPATLDNATA